jgi:hypothetical protein
MEAVQQWPPRTGLLRHDGRMHLGFPNQRDPGSVAPTQTSSRIGHLPPVGRGSAYGRRSGNPTIISDVIENWQDGVVVPTDMSTHYLSAMRRLAHEPDLRWRLAVAGANKAADFTRER